MSHTEEEQLNYTVFVRLPFPRGDFVDPPLIKWNGSKDAELWKVLSSNPKGGEIDWHALTDKFDVALPFLLQQAAWLYARQLSQVREQLRRANKPSSNSPTPPPTSGSTNVTGFGGHAMKRGGSGGANSRVPSALSVRPRGSSELRNDTSTPSTPIQGRVPYSRTASATTITQIPKTSSMIQNHSTTSPKQQRRSIDSERAESRLYMKETISNQSPQTTNLDSPSASSSDDDEPMTHSRAFPRKHRFSTTKPPNKEPLQVLSSADEEEDDDSPAFLPFTKPNTQPIGRTDSKGKAPVRPLAPTLVPTSTSASSNSLSQSHHSSSDPSVPSPSIRNNHHSSPTGQALAALSPRQRRIVQAGSESGGTPSMGSSFSDLDDASITQSALEEALAREIKAGKGSLGVVGRMGGLWKQGMGGQGGGGSAAGGNSRAV